MGIENNLQDFDEALAAMQDSIELLDSCVDDTIMKTLSKVVDEYEGHLRDDIDKLIEQNKELLSSKNPNS